MDDLELEGRLRKRLHQRFDDAPIPAGLVSNVRQAVTTEPRPVGFAIRSRPIRLGWAAVAAAVVLAVVALGIGKGFGPNGPGGPATPTPSMGATASPYRLFVVLPPGVAQIDKPDSGLATDVLSARVRALGIGTFSSGGGDVISFALPTAGASDASIRSVLAATGDVRIVPLPPADYGEGKLSATIGNPLPKDEPALFGWEAIASVTSDATGPTPGLSIKLKTAGAQAFGDYTSAHVGETLAIVIDGRVALLPVVTSPITSGEITLTSGQLPNTPARDDAFAVAAAILVGGMLPEAWRGASVPVLISPDQAEAAALAATHGGTVRVSNRSVQISTSVSGDAWQVSWNIEVVPPECTDVSSCVSPGWSMLVRVDAVTGTVLHVGALEP